MAMTRDEFQHACKRHGLTVAEFAHEFGVAESTCYQWGARTGVPRWAMRILAAMDQHGRQVLVRDAGFRASSPSTSDRAERSPVQTLPARKEPVTRPAGEADSAREDAA